MSTAVIKANVFLKRLNDNSIFMIIVIMHLACMSIRSPGIYLPARELGRSIRRNIPGIPNLENVVDERIYELFKFIPIKVYFTGTFEPIFENQNFNFFKSAGEKGKCGVIPS